MSLTEQWQGRWDAALMGNYGTPPVVLARGSGATVWDVDGKEYVDLLGGIAVNLLGHAHPAVVDAVTRQISTLGHTSNLAAHEPGILQHSEVERQPRLCRIQCALKIADALLARAQHVEHCQARLIGERLDGGSVLH